MESALVLLLQKLKIFLALTEIFRIRGITDIKPRMAIIRRENLCVDRQNQTIYTAISNSFFYVRTF